MSGSGSRFGGTLGGGGRGRGCCPIIGGGKARSEGGGEVEGGLGIAEGGQVVGGRGEKGNFASVVVDEGTGVLGLVVAFDRRSECVRLDLGP